jgi:hypothetical protein
MPLVPGGRRYGFGIWNSLPATLALEFTIFAIGITLYYGTTRPKDGVGRYALAGLLAFLFVVYLASIFGPPPPNERVLAFSALAIWLTVPWGAWADRHRSTQT